MGYTTEFNGWFELDKALDDGTFEFLLKLNRTRRMGRNLPTHFGVEGEFFVDGTGVFSAADESIIDYNTPPKTQPGLWCRWKPTDDKLHIEWDGGEKFYRYVEWIEYLIDKVLKPRGYTLNGEVLWRGEDWSDSGTIVVSKNSVTTR